MKKTFHKWTKVYVLNVRRYNVGFPKKGRMHEPAAITGDLVYENLAMHPYHFLTEKVDRKDSQIFLFCF
jgi:hypothetical protein